jgi:hypothetical protein
MKLVDAVQRAIHEPDFANRLKAAALKAYPTPAGSNEWNDFLGFFAATPSDLAALNTPVAVGAGPATPGIPPTTSTPLLAGAATSTNVCTITTTTTTGSFACADLAVAGAEAEEGLFAA